LLSLKSPLGSAVSCFCAGAIQGAAAPQKRAKPEPTSCTRISENKPHQARTVRPLKPRVRAARTASYTWPRYHRGSGLKKKAARMCLFWRAGAGVRRGLVICFLPPLGAWCIVCCVAYVVSLYVLVLALFFLILIADSTFGSRHADRDHLHIEQIATPATPFAFAFACLCLCLCWLCWLCWPRLSPLACVLPRSPLPTLRCLHPRSQVQVSTALAAPPTAFWPLDKRTAYISAMK
jgi:hypothetical protein